MTPHGQMTSTIRSSLYPIRIYIQNTSSISLGLFDSSYELLFGDNQESVSIGQRSLKRECTDIRQPLMRRPYAVESSPLWDWTPDWTYISGPTSLALTNEVLCSRVVHKSIKPPLGGGLLFMCRTLLGGNILS